MSERTVSADEARDYIRMATPGPWAEAATTDLSESGRMAIVRRDVPDHVIVETGIVDADDANLMSAAPDLAHTVVVQAEQIAAVLALLSALVDPDPCSFDHNGGCQAHGFSSLMPGETCPNADAKALLGAEQ